MADFAITISNLTNMRHRCQPLFLVELIRFAPVAQRIEQDGSNVKVVGPIPAGGTKQKTSLFVRDFLFSAPQVDGLRRPALRDKTVRYSNAVRIRDFPTGGTRY